MNTLHTFAVAARRLNFSQASEELNLTHAAVSMQIKKLEDWFGRRLFERTSRGLLLTDAGRELLSSVDSALSTISTTSQRLRLTRERRSISVACLPSVATRWLVPGLADFLSKHPDVSVEISYAEALKPFNSDYHDILISHMIAAPEGLVSRRLFRRTSKPVASPAYVERNRATLENRLDGARLLHDASMTGWEDWSLSASKSLILLGTKSSGFRIPRAHPDALPPKAGGRGWYPQPPCSVRITFPDMHRTS